MPRTRKRRQISHDITQIIEDNKRRRLAALEHLISNGREQARDSKLPADIRKAGFWLAAGISTAIATLSGCAAQIGSSITQDATRRDLVNGSPVTVTVDDNSGERVTVNGTAASGYAVTGDTESRWLYSGASPVSISMRRGENGAWAANMASAKDATLAAEQVNIDPNSGRIEARGLRVSSDAATPLRAGNEALDRLGEYWTTRDEAARQVLIEQIQTTGQVPKELAPFIVQLLLGL